jgi:hypothetical protein
MVEFYGNEMRFVAFLATEYDKVLLGYQLGQMVEHWFFHRSTI